MNTQRISIRGRVSEVPSLEVQNACVIVRGKYLKIAGIFDEEWIEKRNLPDPSVALQMLKQQVNRPDLFTFAQRVPDSHPRFNFFLDWDNRAVLRLTTYEEWFRKKIPSATRRNIRASINRGVEVKECSYDEAYVEGIASIYNESPIRQGRWFWHYGKSFEATKAENGTYADRSTFLAAYFNGEMIGYLKLIWDLDTAAIMQILSKAAFYDKRPNNALISEAVKLCCSKGVRYLVCNQMVYGTKVDSSLVRFKQSNGFERMDLPRYFIPLTWQGSLALKLGFHTPLKGKLPRWMVSRFVHVRARWYALRLRRKSCLESGSDTRSV
jgi:hypothetical protein